MVLVTWSSFSASLGFFGSLVARDFVLCCGQVVSTVSSFSRRTGSPSSPVAARRLYGGRERGVWGGGEGCAAIQGRLCDDPERSRFIASSPALFGWLEQTLATPRLRTSC